jgi:GT2 family glycosyltransferase
MSLRARAFGLLSAARRRALRSPALYALAQRVGRTQAGRAVIGWAMRSPERQAPGYADWVAAYDTLTDDDRRGIGRHVGQLASRPTISVVMPVYETPEPLLRAAIESVRAQLYPHWELCIADDASPSRKVWEILEGYAAADPRIRIVRRGENGHISAATNSALALATGAFVALLDHDDLLAETALYRVAVAVNEAPDAALIFSDEDRADASGRRTEPYFKPGFDYELFLQHNLVSHLGVYRRDLVMELGGLRLGFEGSQDHDLALRVLERAGRDRVRHIPAVLYHWREDPADGSFSQRRLEDCAAASQRAVQEHLRRSGEPAQVVLRSAPLGWLSVRREPPSPQPKVSLVAAPETWAEALLAATGGPVVEIVANPHDAAGELLLFVKPGLTPSTRSWLEILVAEALRPDVAAAGARVHGPDGRLRHGGYLVRPNGAEVAVRIDYGLPGREPGYWGRLMLAREVTALSADALVVRRAVWDQLGGFDPAFSGDLAALDFALKARAAGYRLVWRPDAELQDPDPRWPGAGLTGSADELRRLRARWGPALAEDARASPNLDSRLADGSLAFPPAVVRPWRSPA